MDWWKRVLAGVLLIAFLATKGTFWFALIPNNNSHLLPEAHPCACTGETVCHCGPEGCCGTADPEPENNGLVVGAPKICGSLSKGIGVLAETPCVLALCWNVGLIPPSSGWCIAIVLLIHSAGSEDPDPPIPKY